MRIPTTAATLALAVLFGLSGLQAQQQPGTAQRERANQQQEQATAQQAELPEMLRSLDLNDQQNQKIKQIVAQHDQKLSEISKQFDKQHKKAVTLEAVWATALESQMDETQKQKFRQSREKARQEGTRSEVFYRGQPAEQPDTQRQGEQPQGTRPGQQQQNQQQPNQQQQQQKQQVQQESPRPGQSAQQSQQGTQPTAHTAQQGERVVIIAITSPRQYYTAAGLSDDQQRKCDKMCEAFHQEIGSVWRELRNLHMEMVNIESEKISAIQEVLTEEQLQQLKREHEQFETSTKDSSTKETEPDGAIRSPEGQPRRTFKNDNQN